MTRAFLGLMILGFVLFAAACKTPPAPPPENVKLPSDIPMAEGFAFSQTNPPPRTQDAPVRFARYGYTCSGAYGRDRAATHFKAALPGAGWEFVGDEMNVNNTGWTGLWRKKSDKVRVTYSEKVEYLGDDKRVTSCLVVELN